MPRTVLVTGCSSGIGRAAADAFLEGGWNVVATMRDPAAWNGPATDRLLIAPLDVTDPASIAAVVAAAMDLFGRIDCLVNNAGQALLSVVETTPIEAVRRIFDVNVFGPLRMMQALLPIFRTQGGGRIVNVGSGSAIAPDPFMALYSASKCALSGLSEGMRHELRGQNVSMKLVEPGYVPGTRLGETVRANSKGIPVPASYRDDHDRITAMFTGAAPSGATSERDVAAAILTAAHDEGDGFRFVVGADARRAAHMRRETSEAAYLRWTSERFGPTS